MGKEVNKYKFSFVMPVYNVEDYLAETVESILAQTMDFEQNCEIVFVNDGSPDNSEEVCLRYQKQFPQNIKYIKQKNSGVSAARNHGVELAEGKYISFLDSDDKLSPDTLRSVYDFFEMHYDEIDLASIRLEFFEASTGNHMLNYKFHKSRVVDIQKEHESIQLSGGSIFVKRQAIQEKKYKFDESLKYAEDVKFITEIVLDKLAYGVVAGPIYHYRKRQLATSALSNTVRDKSWYFDVPEKVHEYLFGLSRNQTGSIPRYIQYLVMYDLQWKYKQADASFLDQAEVKKFKKLLKSLIVNIDDDIILAQRNIWPEHKFFILSQKYNQPALDKVVKRSGSFYFNNVKITKFVDWLRPEIVVEILELKNGTLFAEGYIKGLVLRKDSYYFKIAGKKYSLDFFDRKQRRAMFLDEIITDGNCFRVDMPVPTSGTHEAAAFFIPTEGHEEKISLVMRRFSGLNNFSRNAYRVQKPYIVTRRLHSIRIEPYSSLRHVKKELLYDLALFVRIKRDFIKQKLKEEGLGRPEKLKVLILTPVRSVSRNLYSIFIRWVLYISNVAGGVANKKDIWLISDRIMAAGDNGEALFRYLLKNPDSSIKPYFAISKKSPDYGRLKTYGPNVVHHGGLRYKLLFLKSKKLISSHADEFVINAYGQLWPDFIDLYRFDYVFLQHGITKDDLSSWLNKYNKNIKLFLTSSKREQLSVIDGPYYYDKNVVQLTGMPRYDFLESKPAGKLILSPTWRQGLAGKTDIKTGARSNSEAFKKTEYYKFYQAVISDKRVLDALRANDMTGEFYLHPALSAQVKDFEGNKQFVIKDVPYDYKTAFKEGNLLVTDYSSVYFDFAYLKKPVIYAHFDHETFFAGHLYDKGYFSYEKDGFGPVAYDYESLISYILESIAKQCEMSSTYQKRVDRFFAYTDKHNSKRLYQAVKQIK